MSHRQQWIVGGTVGVAIPLALYAGFLTSAIAVGVAACITGRRALRGTDRTRGPRRLRTFYRDEIAAVLALEAEGVRCPSTFDDGAYLRECTGSYIAAAKEARLA